jgi:hypothetical protein
MEEKYNFESKVLLSKYDEKKLEKQGIVLDETGSYD